MSSSRQFGKILFLLEILNFCSDGGNGNFIYSIFKATSLIYEAPLSLAAHQKKNICFFLIVMDD